MPAVPGLCATAHSRINVPRVPEDDDLEQHFLARRHAEGRVPAHMTQKHASIRRHTQHPAPSSVSATRRAAWTLLRAWHCPRDTPAGSAQLTPCMHVLRLRYDFLSASIHDMARPPHRRACTANTGVACSPVHPLPRTTRRQLAAAATRHLLVQSVSNTQACTPRCHGACILTSCVTCADVHFLPQSQPSGLKKHDFLLLRQIMEGTLRPCKEGGDGRRRVRRRH